MTDTLLFDTTDLEPLLAQGWLALTPNRRLASRIHAAVLQHAAAQGKTALPTPQVLALADWLDQLWAQLSFTDLDRDAAWLLDSDQERALWQRVVEESDAGKLLLRPAEAAQQAQEAYRTLALWRQLPLGRDVAAEFESTEDTRAFRGWLGEFHRRCSALGCIAVAERDRQLLVAVETGKLVLPTAVVAVAFDELTPLHRALLEFVSQRRSLSAPARNRSIAALGCDDLTSQLRNAGHWARLRLQANPAAPVAIVVPQLTQQRATVERLLRDCFEPDHAAPETTHRPPSFNISAGAALCDVPMIAAALQLLGLVRREQVRGPLLALFDSPFHGFAEPLEANARAIAAICALGSERIGTAQLRTLAGAIAEVFPMWSLSNRLQQLNDRVRRERLLQLRLTPGQWCVYIDELLLLLGWPGTRPLDSIEYQQREHWQRALADLARLDSVLATISFDDTLRVLQELLSARLFQPKTADAPLQVLGLLEAAGLQFDALWLCEMGDDLWPPAAAPHPLLPRDLQRRLAMPHSDATREQTFAARLTRSLIDAAGDVVVSYQQQRDDVKRKLSPLFGQVPTLVIDQLVELYKGSLFALENFAPGPAPTLNPKARARGGSGILASQSACPFQAFARHRLGARPLDDVVEGLDASERGQLLHGALEIIWHALGGSAALAQIGDEPLQALIDSAAADVVMALRQQIPERFGARFSTLEQKRLAVLLAAWLKIERERPPFTVAALEQSRELSLGELTLQLRVDRIDRLADGRQLIIDYKSGRSSISAWRGERPEQPQLPMYGAALEREQPGSVAGLLFAQIRSDGAKLTGLGDGELEGHGIEATEQAWPQQLDDWRAALLMLADEYVHGRADVAPSSARACQYCDLHDLCRIGSAMTEAESGAMENGSEASA